jgi:lipopolysaccharide/colanic/teichoic acid biosynthesis glycosyltransferase
VSDVALLERLEGAQAIPDQRRHWAAKRLFDFVLGTMLGLLLLPLVLVLAVVIAVRLRAWPFFVHDRIGQGGKLIRFPKLRTLPRHTPPYAQKHEFDLAVPGRFFAFLRDRHIDELPQIYLVPLGRLSLVGPRAMMQIEFDQSPAGYRDARLLVPQGCTGMWQVGDHTDLRVVDNPDYDFAYLQYGSIRLDLWIVWRTCLQMLGAGAADLRRVPHWTLGKGFVTSQQLEAVDATRFSLAADLVGRPIIKEHRRLRRDARLGVGDPLSAGASSADSLVLESLSSEG